MVLDFPGVMAYIKGHAHYPYHYFSPSVICSANATSLVRGRLSQKEGFLHDRRSYFKETL